MGGRPPIPSAILTAAIVTHFWFAIAAGSTTKGIVAPSRTRWPELSLGTFISWWLAARSPWGCCCQPLSPSTKTYSIPNLHIKVGNHGCKTKLFPQCHPKVKHCSLLSSLLVAIPSLDSQTDPVWFKVQQKSVRPHSFCCFSFTSLIRKHHRT